MKISQIPEHDVYKLSVGENIDSKICKDLHSFAKFIKIYRDLNIKINVRIHRIWRCLQDSSRFAKICKIYKDILNSLRFVKICKMRQN